MPMAIRMLVTILSHAENEPDTDYVQTNRNYGISAESRGMTTYLYS